MTSESRTLFIALVEIPNEHAADFQRWRDEEMVPNQLAVPGFLSVRCFEAVEAPENPYHGDNLTARFLNIYEVDHLSTLQKAAEESGTDQSEWSKRVHANMTRVSLNAYTEVTPRTANPG